MKDETLTPADVVYTPNEIVGLGAKYLDYRRNNKEAGLPIGLESLDKDFLRVVSGELVSIIARPGNGKTGFMMRWARHRAKWLADNKIENKIVVYATWEQSIEELYAFNLAADARMSITDMARGNITDEEWNQILRHGNQRMAVPLWFIGHSLARRKKRPQLTVSLLGQALNEIENWSDFAGRNEIDCIFVDYLQRVRLDKQVESKTIGVSDTLDRLKDAALAFGCPVVCGVQATRGVDERDMPIPQMDDGQWTSNVEQASDKVISLVRPRKYRKEEEKFGDMVVRGHNQMLVSVIKQKLGKDNWAKWVSFEPEYNKLDELEERTYKGE